MPEKVLRNASRCQGEMQTAISGGFPEKSACRHSRNLMNFFALSRRLKNCGLIGTPTGGAMARFIG